MTNTLQFKTNHGNKTNGSNLTADEWNGIMQDLDTLVNNVPTEVSGGSGDSVVTVTDVTVPNGDATVNVAIASGVQDIASPDVIQLTKKKKGVNTTLVSGNNVNIEPRESVGETKGGNISFKPGDDIEFCSHHRLSGNQDEVSMKIINGSDEPVKLQLNASEMTLTTKDKTGDDANVFDINVNKGKNQKGYLKVRAQAIDLRCEDHGGIALQPKGEDSDHNQNKIKFEHGGGDGLEFGTFNTEKTSIFTNEYRFNKEGVWKMATRTKQLSDKYDDTDETTHYKYVKAADDFYDNISQDDEQCTTKDIIKTAFAMNGGKDRHTKITNKGAIEIATNIAYRVHFGVSENWTQQPANISTISTKISNEMLLSNNPTAEFEGKLYNAGDFDNGATPNTTGTVGYECGRGLFISFTEIPAPNIKIDSGAELKLGGILDFGSSFNFGETDHGIETQYKLTKQNNTEDCGVLKVIGINNNTSNDLTVTNLDPSDGVVTDYVIPHGTTDTPVIANCSINDIIMFINWAKYNQQGPWATLAISNKKTMTYDQGNGLIAGQWLSNQMVNPGEPA